MKFSPEIRPQVHRMIAELDDGATGIATIWRDVGHRARRRKLVQPSYESVRRLVHEHRRLKQLEYARLKRCVAGSVGRLREASDPSTVMLLILVGDTLHRRLREYRRSARDESSRTTTRATA